MHITFGVVEDSNEDFVALERTITRGGFEIVVERWLTGEDLLAEVRASPESRTRWPDLFLIDLNLIGMDGVSLVASLRAEISTRPLPLFILSGSARPRDVDRSYAAGASLYLTKPLDRTHIQAAIDLLDATPGRRQR